MANISRPIGFLPYGPILDASAYVAGGSIYVGDAVTMDSTGRVVVAAASDPLLGVALQSAAVTESILVADDPSQKFIGEVDDSTIDAQTDFNLNYNIVAASADATYSVSRHVIDGNTGAEDTDLPIKVLFIDHKLNNALGANVKVVFKINRHLLGSEVGALGI